MSDAEKLWLWRDGEDRFLAFRSLFPTMPGCGDPATLGQPSGYAFYHPMTLAEAQKVSSEHAPLWRAARNLMLYADECALILKQNGYPAKAQSLEARVAAVDAALAGKVDADEKAGITQLREAKEPSSELLRLKSLNAELREGLRELTDAAESDLIANQGDGDEAGGWWSLRQENAIAKARSLLSRTT